MNDLIVIDDPFPFHNSHPPVSGQAVINIDEIFPVQKLYPEERFALQILGSIERERGIEKEREKGKNERNLLVCVQLSLR